MKTLLFVISFLLINLAGFGQTATFLSNFEDQNIDPEIGSSAFETGTSGGYQIVANPHPDTYNSSNYVLKVYTEPGIGGRAEYRVQRMETNEKKYIYTWKRFFPKDMWTDVEHWFCSQNQWKTWPCESGGSGDYAIYDSLICKGAGIFNDMSLYVDNTGDYRSRAFPNCNYDFVFMQEGIWHEFTLEIYWTNTDNGYYRIWRNDTLFGYSNNMKTLFDEFPEDDCNIYWTTGLYTGWAKTGGETTDSLIAYLDDIAVYDIDSGYTITDVCPECEVAPAIPKDSSVYKINMHYSAGAADGYNNYIVDWRGDTCKIDLSNTFGQNNGIDIYLWSGTSSTSNNLSDDCFPEDVIQTAIQWSNSKTHNLYLSDLDPNNTYTVKVLSAGGNNSSAGTQIWTTEENRDTILSMGNTCDMAELTGLVSDETGDLTIHVASIGGRAYINAIEIVEYVENNVTSNKKNEFNDLIIFPNPVNDNLFVKGDTVPTNITIYSSDGKKVKYAENTNTVNISDFKKGIYIVLVNMQESFTTIKIVKE
jgi:hypothetical protein